MYFNHSSENSWGEWRGRKAEGRKEQSKSWKKGKVRYKVTDLHPFHPKLQLLSEMEGSCIHLDGTVYLCHFPLLRFCRSYFKPTLYSSVAGLPDLNKQFSRVRQKQRKKANECLEDASPSGSHLMVPCCYRLVTTSDTVGRGNGESINSGAAQGSQNC